MPATRVLTPVAIAVLAIAVLAIAASAPARPAADTSIRGDARASHARAQSPALRWSRPKDGRTVSGRLSKRARNCIVSARPRRRIDHVSFYVDGTRLNTDHSAPFSCVWDTSTAAEDRSHTLRAVAYAKPGRRVSRSGLRAARSVDVRVHHAPRVSWRTRRDGDTVSGQLNESGGNCVASASDGSGIDRVSFYLDGARLNTDRAAPYSCVWDTTRAAEGSSHALRAVAHDSIGSSASASVGVTVDNGGIAGGVGAIPHTGGVVRQDLAADSNFRALWDHINAGPDSRVEHHATGGDPHPLVNGVVNPSWRRINHLSGDEEEGRIRQQLGANSTSDADTFKAYQRGERWITYWSMRIDSVDIPSDTASQVWEMYPEGPKGSGPPPIAFAWRQNNVLRLNMREDDGDKAVLWSDTVPVDTWLRFAIDVKYDTADKSVVQLWGDLSDTGDLSLKPLTGLLTPSGPVLPSGHSASALIAGIYGDDTIPPHHIDFANWQVARWVP